jgi:hypothetical protein
MLAGMLEAVGVPLRERLRFGMDDVDNIARLAIKMMQQGALARTQHKHCARDATHQSN